MQSIIGYDKRSSIPQELIKEIFDKFHPYFCLEHSEVKV
jgi:hypothetical protein